MAIAVGRMCGAGLLKSSTASSLIQSSSYSTREWTRSRRILLGSLGVLAGGAGALLFALDQSVKASDLDLHSPKNPWSHSGPFSSLDHASIKRGYEVYKQVCAACHSMRFIAYRNLVGVSHTEEEAKAEAEEQMITDGPDELGNMFQRPGKLSDYFPSPYPNEEAARAANNGAFPLILATLYQLVMEVCNKSFTLSVGHIYRKAAFHPLEYLSASEDYIFALLTGYCDPPAGIVLREGQYYNPYFTGGAISMAQALFNEVIEYSDGTPASASQLAKDIATFLKWTAEPEHDDRKKMFIKSIGIFGFLIALTYYMKRMKWSTLKTRKIEFKPRK
ncbi:hypothetical protein NQ317_010414 [Molorchus minor]|uniref:Cytochrome c domain-containing protein n=1 Tax=Molorchus minor TaxID=1323400 RepID=A0ABQ9JJJ0_9CUCU|nr:hypothetical protein NQ317_010414 [Molorchus minor]